jgi:transposase
MAIFVLTLTAECMSDKRRRQLSIQRGGWSLLTEEFTQILDEAEDHNKRSSRQSNEKQNRENMHGELEQSNHNAIVSHCRQVK